MLQSLLWALIGVHFIRLGWVQKKIKVQHFLGFRFEDRASLKFSLHHKSTFLSRYAICACGDLCVSIQTNKKIHFSSVAYKPCRSRGGGVVLEKSGYGVGAFAFLS